MARAIWKGSITFGLVNIPIELHTAVGDAIARLTRGGNNKFLDKLKEAAAKEFERSWLRERMKALQGFVRASRIPLSSRSSRTAATQKASAGASLDPSKIASASTVSSPRQRASAAGEPSAGSTLPPGNA